MEIAVKDIKGWIIKQLKTKYPNWKLEMGAIPYLTKTEIVSRMLIPGCIIVLYMIWEPLVLIGIPGFFFFFSKKLEDDPISTFFFMCGVSFSIWIAAFWLLPYLPVSLSDGCKAIIVASAIGSFFLRKTESVYDEVIISWQTVTLWICFFIIGLSRFSPMLFSNTPAGADMSMHTYITALIINADGVPNSYQPLLNIESFNTFPVGFHVISALIALLTQMEAYKAAFIFTCFVYFLLTGAFYCLLRYYFSRPISMITAFWFTFLIKACQGFIGWGGNPSTFAFIFALLFLSAIIRIDTWRSPYVPIAAFLLTGLFQTHTIIFVHSFYILGIPCLYLMLASKKAIRSVSPAMGLLIACFFLFSTPYLIQLDYDIVTDALIERIKTWVRTMSHVWSGSFSNFYWSIPVYIDKQLFFNNMWFSFPIRMMSVLFSLAGLAVIICKHRNLLWPCFAIMGMTVLIILNTQYWILPLSFIIIPERVPIFATIPLALMGAFGLEKLANTLWRQSIFRKSIFKPAISGLLLLLMITGGAYTVGKHYAGVISGLSPVTDDDIKGFEWLKTYTTVSDTIETQYGDAGLWIPGMVGRKCTTTHVNFAHQDKLKPIETPPIYVFIGSKCVYADTCAKTVAAFSGNSNATLEFQSGKTAIFKWR